MAWTIDVSAEYSLGGRCRIPLVCSVESIRIDSITHGQELQMEISAYFLA